LIPLPRTWVGTRPISAVSKLLAEMPNVYVDVGAVLYDIGRQPRGSHDIFVKFQDRILGKDAYQPEEYPYYWACSRRTTTTSTTEQ
jgi:hypothetical protein